MNIFDLYNINMEKLRDVINFSVNEHIFNYYIERKRFFFKLQNEMILLNSCLQCKLQHEYSSISNYDNYAIGNRLAMFEFLQQPHYCKKYIHQTGFECGFCHETVYINRKCKCNIKYYQSHCYICGNIIYSLAPFNYNVSVCDVCNNIFEVDTEIITDVINKKISLPSIDNDWKLYYKALEEGKISNDNIPNFCSEETEDVF